MRRALLVAVTVLAASCMAGAPDACEAAARLEAAPVLASGPGPATEIRATSTAPDDLSAGGTLFLRVRFAGTAVPDHQVFVDTDGSRTTGMWTLQSPVSAPGWDALVDPAGRLHHHDGPPTAWSWRAVGTMGRTLGPGHVDLCIPIEALGGSPPARVRIGVLVGEEAWLPGAFLPGAAYPAEPVPEPSVPTGPPARLAFHYGAAPWEVRDCRTPPCAAGVYAGFGHVVLGAGLEEPDHPGHGGTRELVAVLRAANPDVEVWGYVSLVGGPEGPNGRRTRRHTPEDVERRAEAWRRLGATGIFLDEAGLCAPDRGQDCPEDPDGEPIAVTRGIQSDAVASVHALGLPVFANAFAPLDVLGPVDGAPSPLGGRAAGRPADVYLLENPTVAAGDVLTGVDADVREAKYAQAARARDELGVRLAAVDTGAGPLPDAGDDRYPTAYARALEAGVDAYGYTNPVYSAPPELSRNLPLLEAPAAVGGGAPRPVG